MFARGGFMRPAWYAVTAATVLGTACIDPTATGVRGIATLGGTPTDQLAFPVQPSGAVAGRIITPAVQVAALDSLGNTDLSFTGAVTVSLGNNPGGGFLGGTRTVGAVNGVASFGDLTVSSAGTGYTLVASASGATDATSNAFNITRP
jgi:hypothetical protein